MRHALAAGGEGGDRDGGGVAGLVNSMSRGALLASAITIGGAIGVSVSVGLKDHEVRLAPGTEISFDQRTQALLREGVALKVPDALAVKLEPSTTLEVLRTQLDMLAELLLTNPYPPSRNSDLDLQPLLDAVNGLTDAVKNNGKRLESTVQKLEQIRILQDSASTKLQQIARVLGKIQSEVEGESSPDILNSLNAIDEQLRKINTRVQQLVPDRPVRGVIEGARP